MQRMSAIASENAWLLRPFGPGRHCRRTACLCSAMLEQASVWSPILRELPSSQLLLTLLSAVLPIFWCFHQLIPLPHLQFVQQGAHQVPGLDMLSILWPLPAGYPSILRTLALFYSQTGVAVAISCLPDLTSLLEPAPMLGIYHLLM